ncbi:MAG: DUF3822 family protein [Bacteroidales bacterium]|jgi:hypothetical protein|nr:DUF3822 family protein [Bacteroidales bacterium]
MNKKNAILTFYHVNDETNSDISNERKVIRMMSEGFCIGIVSRSNKLEQLFQYSFDTNLSFEDKLTAIDEVDKEKNISCSENIFKLYTKYNVQIPEEFHDRNANEAVLSLITDEKEQYIPFEEKVAQWNLYNLSAWEKDLYEQIKIQFPNYQLATVASSLLNMISRQQQKENVLVFVENNNFTIAVTDIQKLKGINTFPFNTEKDFVYYCCSFLRKMFENMSAVSIKLCGNITCQSPLHNGLSKYFQDVEILSSTDENPTSIDNLYACYCDLFE